MGWYAVMEGNIVIVLCKKIGQVDALSLPRIFRRGSEAVPCRAVLWDGVVMERRPDHMGTWWVRCKRMGHKS